MSNDNDKTAGEVRGEEGGVPEIEERAPALSEPEAPAESEAATGEPAEKEPAEREPEVEPARPPRRGGGVWLALLALLLAGAVGAGGYYGWRLLDERISGLGATLGPLPERIAAGGEQLSTLRANLDAQRDALELRDKGLEESIQVLREQSGRDQAEWILAEAEYLMLVANHRLRLERDVGSALEALKAADARLRATGDPRLLPTREQLGAEIAALGSVDQPDVAGLAAILAGLADQVEALPLKAQYVPAEPAAVQAGGGETGGDWREAAGAAWSKLKGLVTVRRTEEAVRPLLPPEQQYFLRQNLRLKIESARLALLRGESAQLGEISAEAAAWIGQYFDAEAQSSQNMIAELGRIGATELRPALPDIGGSVAALRQFRQSSDR